MEYNISLRTSLTSKQKLRDYISQGQFKSWETDLNLGIKLRDQNAYFAFLKLPNGSYLGHLCPANLTMANTENPQLPQCS
jgi:hypothetical protein